MLRIDHPRARSRETESGTDRVFSKRQPRDPIRRRNPKADLSLDRAGAGPAGVPPAEPPRARFVTQLCGEDDGPEPGAGDAVDRSLSVANTCPLVTVTFIQSSTPRDLLSATIVRGQCVMYIFAHGNTAARIRFCRHPLRQRCKHCALFAELSL